MWRNSTLQMKHSDDKYAALSHSSIILPNYHEYEFSEKCDSGGIFGSCTNITDNLRTKLILVPVECPDVALFVGTKIDSVRTLSTVLP